MMRVYYGWGGRPGGLAHPAPVGFSGRGSFSLVMACVISVTSPACYEQADDEDAYGCAGEEAGKEAADDGGR